MCQLTIAEIWSRHRIGNEILLYGMDESEYFLAFALAPNIGPVRFSKIVDSAGSVEEAWHADINSFLKAGLSEALYDEFNHFRSSHNHSEYQKKLKKNNVVFISQKHDHYPQSLFQLSNPPIGLFAKGNISLLLRDSIAVVGSRKISSYGLQVTEKIVSELSPRFCIVSGLALGVDARAHTTTLKNKGETVAVLGCGVDCCYPQENLAIYRTILEQNGLVISEYGLSIPPSKGSFPARNRIIASLSQAVLVTEAGIGSGSLITAQYAQKLSKKVFVVPGPVTSLQSQGTFQLLKQGGIPVSSSEDIFEVFGNTVQSFTRSVRSYDHLPVIQQQIMEFIVDQPLTIDELVKISHIPAHQLIAQMVELEMSEVIHQSVNGKFHPK